MNCRKEFLVEPGRPPRLDRRDPRADGGLNKAGGRKRLRKNLQRLSDLQYLLYAEGQRAVLVVLQAMDAGGKDGLIRKVMGPLNPQSCKVTSFKAPSAEELRHDFLWRIHRAVPGTGEIGIFNRSHYEDVLIARVRSLVPEEVWRDRYEQIRQFERILAANNVRILKFFLHISKDEQLERLKARLEDPRKQWKADPADFEERRRWDDYMAAYEEALAECSTPEAPWYVLPADRKWFRNVAFSEILAETLEEMEMQLPPPAFDLSRIVPE